jgi:hypothetical protein
MMETTGRMGVGKKHCGDCPRLENARLMKSAAGFYVGTQDDEGPFCRITPYSNNDVLTIAAFTVGSGDYLDD